MRHNSLGFLQNPLFIVPPLLLILGISWHQYAYAGRNFSLPGPNNLLTDSGFANFNSDGIPSGWQIKNAGSLQFNTYRDQGYATGNSLRVSVSHYAGGDLSLESPKIDLNAGTSYLLKSYYKSSMGFTLLARIYHRDGSSELRQIKTYEESGSTWSTFGSAFKAAPNEVAVQVIIHVYGNGDLSINDPYFEPAQDVDIAPDLRGQNLVPNSELLPGIYNTPVSWTAYQGGNNLATFSYVQDDGPPYLQVDVSSYKDGQAKWQYLPQAVKPNQYFNLSLSYKSNVSVPLIAECQLLDGSVQDQTLSILPPTDDWTSITNQFQATPNCTNLFVALVLSANGSLASRDYSLNEIPLSGTNDWSNAIVSITFDDGWQSEFTNALPLLNKYSYKATFYVNAATIEHRAT